MVRASYEDRLEQIRRTEFGSRAEILTRHVMVVLGAGVVWLSYSQPLALIWAMIHVGLHIVYTLLLTNRGYLPARERYRASVAIHMLAGLNFAAYPLHLLANDVPLPLMVAATCSLFGHAMYILQRRQIDPVVMIVDVLQSTAVAVLFVVVILPQAQGARDAALLIAIPSVLLAYYLVLLFSGHRQEQRLRDTQTRYATSQKARALNQFVGGVAHDFNNQLTAILGHLELFDLLDDPAERKQAIEQSRGAARRAALTVQQLLASSGRTRLLPRAVPMASFLTDLKNVLGDLLAPGMRITIVPPTDGEHAWVDADMLETCMIQLCLNAQDATLGNGKIRIWVETHDTLPAEDLAAIDADPPYAVLVCEDDGPGVPKEAMPLLAEPFYTTKRSSEGAGLGLSAVAGFARQSGGTLIISRAPLAGLRIALALPTQAPTAPTKRHPRQAAASHPATSPTTSHDRPTNETPRRVPTPLVPTN